MKKSLFTILFMLFGIFINANSQTYVYKSSSFAMKYVENGRWTSWSDWESSSLYITINFDTDVVMIYSAQTQIYQIVQYVRNYTDDGEGEQIEFRFIDHDDDRGTLRLRVEKNGNSQIYIEFADVMWVYNVRRITN